MRGRAPYRCVSESTERQCRFGVQHTLAERTSLGTRRTRATADQREAVRGEGCLVGGREPVDPAHLVPQRFGGCRSRRCVVPLCRAHHRLYDRSRLRLGPYLGGESAAALRHALTHVESRTLTDALWGAGWPAPWNEETESEEDQ